MRQVEKLYNAIFHSLAKGFYAPLEKIFSINQRLKQIVHETEECELAAGIDQAGKNLKMNIENILIISQLESGFIQFEKNKNSINRLIEGVILEVRSVFPRAFIRSELPIQELFFDFNFDLMKKALKNILTNAIEYSSQNSPINIVVQNMETAFSISVLNEGIGIEQEAMPFIFEKFYRIPGAGSEGVDLGLTIVKLVVELHQGKLEVKKMDGKGTEVTMFLPKQTIRNI